MSGDDTLLADEPVNEEPPAGESPPDGVLAEVAAQRDEYLDALRRVQAEFENFRRRVQRERDDDFDRATSMVVDRLLPVLDAVDAARAHDPDVLDPVDAVLHPALIALGVERIDPLGERFDPEAHEAVAVNVADEGAARGETVVDVLRVGYRCHGRLLRPAMVRVGRTEE